MFVYKLTSNPSTPVALSVYAASSDGYVRIWDPSTGVARHHVQVCRVEKFGDMEDEELEAVGIISLDVHPVSSFANLCALSMGETCRRKL